jgi:hypothetical protein
MIQRIQPGYFFTLECVFLYLLVFVFYGRSGSIPSIPAILTIAIVGNVLLFFVLKQKLVNNSIPLLIAILLSAAAYFTGFSIFAAILCCIFLYFRFGAFIKDSSLWKDERTNLAILFYSSSVIIFFIGWIFRYPYMNVLFALVIGFTVLYSIGRFLQQMGENNGFRDTIGIASVLGLAVVGTYLTTFLVPVVKYVFYKIFTGLAIIATMIGSPFFAMIEGIVLRVQSVESPDDPFAQVEVGEPDGTYDNAVPASGIPSWFWVVILFVILLVVWYFVRKKSKMVDEEQDKPDFIQLEHNPLSGKQGSKTSFFREPAPNEYMRKLIYQLDQFAGKYHLGRYHHETIREWFHRVGFAENEQLFLAYEKVRYGDINLPKSEAVQFEAFISEVKRGIKERHKR